MATSKKKSRKTAGPETFIAYPRDNSKSFPPHIRTTVSAAVEAGLKERKPFDVHSSRGNIVWTWEQRS